MFDRGKEIWWLFFIKGMSPSQIDDRLGMMEGTAHDRIIARWAWDKERKARNVR